MATLFLPPIPVNIKYTSSIHIEYRGYSFTAQNSNHVLKRFLNFLSKDIDNSHQLKDLRMRAAPLIAGMEVDLNAPLSDEDE